MCGAAYDHLVCVKSLQENIVSANNQTVSQSPPNHPLLADHHIINLSVPSSTNLQAVVSHNLMGRHSIAVPSHDAHAPQMHIRGVIIFDHSLFLLQYTKKV